MVTYYALVVEVRFFPVAGTRAHNNGISAFRGEFGRYSSSSVLDANNAWNIDITSNMSALASFPRSRGWSIRCVARK